MTQGTEGRGPRTGDRLATAEPNAEPGDAGGQRGGRTGDRNAGSQRNQGGGGGWNPLDEWAGDDYRGPLTGGDYRQWSERLRDVEEMLDQDELRNEAARVRDRARTIRAEFTRHGTEPQWDLVLDNIMGPLVELRKEVADQLAHMQTDESLVPIDRDPVPDRYAERVRRYFENLGDQQP